MKVIILAGGSGTRLWPFSRKSFPKQFLKLKGELSFLQQCILRGLALTTPENLFIVTQDRYLDSVRSQVAEIASPLASQILLEPMAKNTAPALAFALKELLLRGCENEEPLLVLPSDHLLSPTSHFVAQVREALPKIERGIVVFGIYPTRPETGYGYIRQGEQGVTFIEKPPLAKVQELLIEGHSYWNAGIFLFSMRSFLEEAKEYSPELYDYMSGTKSFEDLEPISLDYALIEKSPSLQCVPLTLTWSDVGSWESIYELSEKDEEGNVLRGNVRSMKTRNSLVFAENRLVTTLGVEDLYIIETSDALLVMHKNEAQRVKELVEQLKQAELPESDDHKTIYRPWGSYTVLEEGVRHKIKQIVIYPHQSLSLQMHYHRSEHWVVVSGTARVLIGDKEEIVHEEESIFVPKSAVHRVTNPGRVPLKIIEVQVGEYLGEDDIVRYDDIYGRV